MDLPPLPHYIHQQFQLKELDIPLIGCCCSDSSCPLFSSLYSSAAPLALLCPRVRSTLKTKSDKKN
jgi:hypothetical protein